MQVTINIPDCYPKDKLPFRLKEIEAILQQETMPPHQEWRHSWRKALKNVKGMWKDRDLKVFEQIRQECNRDISSK